VDASLTADLPAVMKNIFRGKTKEQRIKLQAFNATNEKKNQNQNLRMQGKHDALPGWSW